MDKSMDEKSRKSIWLPEKTWQMIESHREKDTKQSIANFIDEAVKHYCCMLDNDSNREILTQELVNVFRDCIKNVEDHISATMFKMAGEQAVLSLLFADLLVNHIDRRELQAYRNDAYDMIRKRHGILMFEDALENAEHVPEGGDC